jgi:hypothetical protein
MLLQQQQQQPPPQQQHTQRWNTAAMSGSQIHNTSGTMCSCGAGGCGMEVHCIGDYQRWRTARYVAAGFMTVATLMNSMVTARHIVIHSTRTAPGNSAAAAVAAAAQLCCCTTAAGRPSTHQHMHQAFSWLLGEVVYDYCCAITEFAGCRQRRGTQAYRGGQQMSG